MAGMLIDCSLARPSISTMKARGATGVLRYITGRPWSSINPRENKDIFPAEAEQLLDAGMSITLNYELDASEAKNAPASKGKGVAQRSERQADDLGYPMACPIFYSIDYDATWAEVDDYLKGVVAGAKRPVGVYAGYRIIEAAARADIGITYFWQACAWSGFRVVLGKPVDERRGNLSRHAHLFQHTIEIHKGGRDWDENRLIKDFPRWRKDPDVPPPITKANPIGIQGFLKIWCLKVPGFPTHKRFWQHMLAKTKDQAGKRYYTGPIDAKIGRVTKAGWQRWRRDNGFGHVTGGPGLKQIRALAAQFGKQNPDQHVPPIKERF